MDNKKSSIDKSLNHLGHAWNEFIESKDNPYRIDDDDLNDFRKAIHDAQRIIFTIKHLQTDEEPLVKPEFPKDRPNTNSTNNI